MNDQSAMIDYEARYPFKDYEKLCYWIARRLAHRSVRMSRSVPDVPYEDLVQEIVIVFLRARVTFKPEMKVSFSTFFTRTALLAYPDLRRNILGRHVDQTTSLNTPLGSSDEDDEATIGDLLVDVAAGDPERDMIRAESVSQALDANPFAKLLVELTIDPPQDFQKIIAEIEAQRSWAKTLGVPDQNENQALPPTALTPSLARKAFRLNWRQRQMATIEGEVA